MRNFYLILILLLANSHLLAQFDSPNLYFEYNQQPLPWATWIEDMDFDGDMDVISVQTDFDWSAVFVYYENLGTSSFANPVFFYNSIAVMYSDLWYDRPVLADVNGDGFKDIVDTDNSGAPIWSNFLDNTGEYYFFPVSSLLVFDDYWDNSYGNFFDDADQDGDLDFIYLTYNNSTQTTDSYWILNDGNWNFTDMISFTVDLPNDVYWSYSLNEDVDSDGDLDAILYGSSAFGIMENDNSASFIFHEIPAILNFFDKGDMDMDGDDDLVVLKTDGLYWLENSGGWNYSVEHLIQYTNSTNIFAIVGDFSGDAIPDVIFSSISYLENVEESDCINDGTGNFSLTTLNYLRSQMLPIESPTDFNGDGDLDMLIGVTYGNYNYFPGCTMAVLYGVEDGSIDQLEPIAYYAFYFLTFDGQDPENDGSVELVANSTDPYAYQDSSGFVTMEFLVDTNDWPDLQSLPVYGDSLHTDQFKLIAHDSLGFKEVARIYYSFADNSNVFSISEYNTFTHQYESIFSFQFDANYVATMEIVDYNNDNLDDVLLMYQPNAFTSEEASLILSDGSGGYSIETIQLPGDVWVKKCFDQNSDGFMDVFYIENGVYSCALGDGSLVFGTPFQLFPEIFTIHHAFDQNHDGLNDILVYDPVQHLSWFNGVTETTFSYAGNINPVMNGNWDIFGCAHDFNQDGYDDLIAAINWSWHYFDFHNDIVTVFSTPLDGLFQCEFNDINHDGFDDWIFFQTGEYYGSNYAGWAKNICYFGCNDPTACNYEINATNNLGCLYGVCGCTDLNACNYDANASADDGSCQLAGCTDSGACNFNPTAICDDGSCSVGANYSLHFFPYGIGNDSSIVSFSVLNESNMMMLFYPITLVDEITSDYNLDCLSEGCYHFIVNATGAFNQDAFVYYEWRNEQGVVLHADTVYGLDLPHSFNSSTQQYEFDTVQPDFGWDVGYYCTCPVSAIGGCTNVNAVNYSTYAECDNGSCLYGVSGVVYNDINADGIMQETDYGLPFQTVTIQPGNFSIVTDNNGYFFMPLPFGQFAVSLTPDPLFPFATNSLTQNMSLYSGNSGTNLMFGISITEPISVMCVDFYPTLSTYVCNDYANFNLCFRNMGNVPLDGILRLEIDPLFTAWNEITPIDSVVGNYIYMSYSNLMPGEMFFYDIELLTPSADYLGTTLVNTAIVNGFYNGMEVAAGMKVREIEHACSFDPNDKQPDPIGFTQDHFIRDDNRIEFLIRFQNTGNAPALNVVIKDTIDSNFDLETFQLVANSHSVMTTVDPNTREVTFYFLEILLPDSVHDEPGSHGLVSYYLTPMSGLDHGTVLQNTASIYFDNNLPVVTNTTFHTIFDCAQYQAQADTNYGGTCYAPLWEAVPNVLWTDQYNWYVDGVLTSNEESFSLSSSGEHEIVLEIDNALCPSQEVSYMVNLDETVQASVLPHASSFCEGESIVLESANTTGNVWYLNGVEVGNNVQLEVSEAGVYSLVVDVNGCLLAPVFAEISEMNGPEVGIINQVQNDLFVLNNVEYVYQWYAENEIIPGANSFLYQIQSSGSYSVLVTSENGCTSIQNIEALFTETSNVSQTALRLFPNPSSGVVMLQGLPANAYVRVYDALGHLVFRSDNPITNQFDLKYLADGMYSFQIMSDETMTNFQLMIQK